MATARVLLRGKSVIGTCYFIQTEFRAVLKSGRRAEVVDGRVNLWIRCQVTGTLDVQDCYRLLEGTQGLVPFFTATVWDETPPKKVVAAGYPLQSTSAVWGFDLDSGNQQLTVSVGGAVVNDQAKLERLVITGLKIVLAATYSCHTNRVCITLANKNFNLFVADD